MTTLTTEDGRVLQFDRGETVLVLHFAQGLAERPKAAEEVDVDTWIRIGGRGRRRDRAIDLARVVQIARRA